MKDYSQPPKIGWLKKFYWGWVNWMFWKLRKLVYSKDDLDWNADYICGFCGKPVLKRYLYCCDKCGLLDEYRMKYGGGKK